MQGLQCPGTARSGSSPKAAAYSLTFRCARPPRPVGCLTGGASALTLIIRPQPHPTCARARAGRLTGRSSINADANHSYPNPTLSRPEARGARPAGMEAGEGEQQQAGLPAPAADRPLALPPGVPAAAALPQYFCVAVSRFPFPAPHAPRGCARHKEQSEPGIERVPAFRAAAEQAAMLTRGRGLRPCICPSTLSDLYMLHVSALGTTRST